MILDPDGTPEAAAKQGKLVGVTIHEWPELAYAEATKYKRRSPGYISRVHKRRIRVDGEVIYLWLVVTRERPKKVKP